MNNDQLTILISPDEHILAARPVAGLGEAQHGHVVLCELVQPAHHGRLLRQRVQQVGRDAHELVLYVGALRLVPTPRLDFVALKYEG